MPKSINQEGNGKAKYFDLIAEEAIIANIPFYPNLQCGKIAQFEDS